MKAIKAITMLLALPMLTPGCILVEEDPHCIGDYCDVIPDGEIWFYWDFELWDGSVTSSCYDADVARVDIYIRNESGHLEYQALSRPCEDQGAMITNFYPGIYSLELVATCRTGTITHEGIWDLDVYSGVNDYGRLPLTYLRPCQ